MITIHLKEKKGLLASLRGRSGRSGLRWGSFIGHLAMTSVMLIFILGFIAGAPPRAHADIPRYINYQGKLLDAEDNPVSGDLSITLRIYDAETGGTALWTEAQTVTVTRGIFSMLLGATTALDELDFNDPYWYSVEVESDGEMTPRQRLTTIAYAINADKLDGYDASDFLMVDASGGSVTGITVSGGLITAGANEDIELNPTGTGNIIMTIDSTSGDFKITDGTTNWLLVDSETGDVSMTQDLTVTGNITLDGNLTDTSGALTIPDAITQTGSTNQVTFEGNVDAENGLDVTGNLTVGGTTTLAGALDMNSNVDLDYSGTSAALDVNQQSTGPAAQFSGAEVLIGSEITENDNIDVAGELYVKGDLEVDGTIYGNITGSGSQSLGDTTLSSLTVTGTSDLQGNVSDSAGTFTIADDLSVTLTDASTSGIATGVAIEPTFQDGGETSTTTAIAMNVAPTIYYTAESKAGSYTALKITATETSVPTSQNYLIDAYAGADGTTQTFYVENDGDGYFAGTVTVAAPTAAMHATTKTYVDTRTWATAGGWTENILNADVYVTDPDDNVGIGTTAPGAYKLDVSGSTNTTSLYIGGTQVTSTAAELNKIDGYTGTAANLSTLTDASNADTLHVHTATGITTDIVSSVEGVTNDGGNIDLVPGTGISITGDDGANTITITGTVTDTDTQLAEAQVNDFIFDGDNTGTMSSGTLALDSLSYTGTLDDTNVNDALTIDGGTIDNSIIGATTAAAATVTQITMNDGTVNTGTLTYDSTAGYPFNFDNKLSVQDIEIRGSSPAVLSFGQDANRTSLIYDPATDEIRFSRGTFSQQFRNLLKNASFEAFSAFEDFHGYDTTYATDTTVWDKTVGYQGGWDNFAPDDWTYVSGKVFQHSPLFFRDDFTAASITDTTYKRDTAEGRSAVRLAAVTVDSVTTPGKISQTISGLKPSTVYSVGVKMRIDAGGTAKIDIENEDGEVPAPLPENTINAFTVLSATVNDTVTSIPVASVANFPVYGTIQIVTGGTTERIRYEGLDDATGANKFLKCTRGSNAATHSIGTTVIVAPFVAQTVTSAGGATNYIKKEGQFSTDRKATNVNIVLSAEAGAAYFDTVQIVAGGTVPEYSPGSIVDTGDQTLYGTLRIGRSSDDKGGILAVDQVIRTRGIDFFENDPGISGTTGGGGTIDQPWTMPNVLDSTIWPKVYLKTSGNYVEPVIRKLQVQLLGTTIAAPTGSMQYRYRDCIDPMRDWEDSAYGEWTSWVTTNVSGGTLAIPIAIDQVVQKVEIQFGIKLSFDRGWDVGNSAEFQGGDTYEFKAFGMSPEMMTYDAFDKDATYRPGSARIYKDPETGELTFEDSRAGSVRLSEIISQSSAGYVSPPVRDTYNTGIMVITAEGDLNTAAFSSEKNFEVGIEYGDPPKYWWNIRQDWATGTYTQWYGNWSQSFTQGIPVSLIATGPDGMQNTGDDVDTGIDITFSEGAYYSGERWTFYATPGSESNVAEHSHTTGPFAASGTSQASWTIGTATDPEDADVVLNFGQTSGEKYIKWDKAENKFVVNGILSATSITGTEPTLTKGDLTESTSSILTITGGTDAVIGTGAAIQVKQASVAQSGYLSSADWGTFNSKLSSESDPLALKTAGTDNVKNTHIDWGIDAGQVSTTDVIEGTSLYYTDARVDTQLDTNQTIGGNWTFSNNVIVPQTPTTATHAASKAYVDAGITGLSWKEAVISIADHTSAPSAEAAGNRYLLTEGVAGVHADWDGAEAGDMVQFNGTSWVEEDPQDGDAVFVENVDTGYVYTGTTWTPFTGASAYTWGTGLSNSGITVNVNLLAADLAVDGNDNIYVVDSGIDHNELANSFAVEHVNWASASAGTIHATNYVDNINDTVSGTELDGVFSTAGLLKRTGAATYATITDSSSNWDTAYTHSQDNSQAHTDYLLNTADTMGGTLTIATATPSDLVIDNTTVGTLAGGNLASDSGAIILRGNYFNDTGDVNTELDMSAKLDITDATTYKLAFYDNTGTNEIASLGQGGALQIDSTLTIGSVALTEANLTDLTDTGSTTLHSHTGLAPGAHATTHQTGAGGTDKVYWSLLDRSNGVTTTISSEIDTDISTHAALTATHGATGAVVGTTNTQTLSNKTLTNPVASQIYGSAAANGNINIDGTSSATKTTSYLLLQSGGGNVGIGTTAPAQVLDVNGDIIADHIISRGGSPATFQFGTGVGAKSLQFDMDTGEFSFTGGKLTQQFQNLIRNGSFEGSQPTGWYSFNDGIYGLDTVQYKFGIKSLKVIDNSSIAAEGASFHFYDTTRLQGERLTLSFWAKTGSGTATASIGFSDSSTDTTADTGEVSNILLDTTWRQFIISYPDTAANSIATAANQVVVYLFGAAGSASTSGNAGDVITGGNVALATQTGGDGYVYIDGVTLVQGNLAMDYGPSPILDTGSQVIYGNLAIGADVSPYSGGAAQLVFGEPDASFGTGYGTWNMGTGSITFEQWSSDYGRFFFNRAMRIYPVGTRGSSLHLMGYPRDTVTYGTSEPMLQVGYDALSNAAADGTYIGINSCGTAADYIHFQRNSDTKFKVDYLGNVTAASISTTGGSSAFTGTSSETFTIDQGSATATQNVTLQFSDDGADSAHYLTWNDGSDRFEMADTLAITGGKNLVVAGTITAGSGPNVITTAAGLLDATKLSGTVPVANLPSDGYASTYVNVGGDTMTDELTLTHTGTANNTQILDINSTGIMADATSKTIASISDSAVHTTNGTITGLEVDFSGGTYTNATARGLNIQMKSASDRAINTNAEIKGGTLTDGTASISGGAVTGLANATVNDGGTLIFKDSDGNYILQLNETARSAQIYNLVVDGAQTIVETTTTQVENLTIDPASSSKVSITVNPSAAAGTMAANFMDLKQSYNGYSVFVINPNGEPIIGKDGFTNYLYFEDGAETDDYLAFDDTNDKFLLSNDISVTGDVDATTIGGIAQANLVDKTAVETISGAWSLGSGALDIAADGTIDVDIDTAGNYTAIDFSTGSALNDASDYYLYMGTTDYWKADKTLAATTVSIDGTLTAGTLSDGTASITSGSLTGVAAITMSGNLTGSATQLDIDKTYTNQTGSVNDHAITRNVILNDATAKTISGAVLTINAVDTQTNGTLTDNSTLLKLQTGANAGATGYFIYAANSVGTEMFKIDKAGNLYTAGGQTIVGSTLYDGTQIIDVTNSEAFLVRQNGDTGNIFVIDTSTPQVNVLTNMDVSGTLNVGMNNAFAVGDTGSVTLAAAATVDGVNISVSHAAIDTHIAATGASVHGLGTISTQAADNVSITGGTISGVSAVTVSSGAVSVDAGQKINFEGTTTEADNSYMSFNSTSNRLDFYVNGEVVAYMKN